MFETTPFTRYRPGEWESVWARLREACLFGPRKEPQDTVVTRRAHTLIISGPYRWVRHPFYDAVALSILANAITAANWFLLLTGSLVVVLLILRTRTEEEKLLLRFGDSYRTYMERTGRFLPKMWT